jgi:hypothetical protein
MHERFAVVFRVGGNAAAGVLEVDDDRLLLRGREGLDDVQLEIPFSELSEVRVARHRSERLNGYATLILERGDPPAAQVAPFEMAFLPEITDLLVSLTRRAESGVLAVVVPLKPGCLRRARKLLAKGPPVDPASLGLTEHEVYLSEAEAVFVFRGSDLRARVGKAIRQPAVWRAGLAWQRCFAEPPRIADLAGLHLDSPPAYRWTSP